MAKSYNHAPSTAGDSPMQADDIDREVAQAGYQDWVKWRADNNSEALHASVASNLSSDSVDKLRQLREQLSNNEANQTTTVDSRVSGDDHEAARQSHRSHSRQVGDVAVSTAQRNGLVGDQPQPKAEATSQVDRAGTMTSDGNHLPPSSAAYDAMSEQGQREATKRARRHTMAEFGLGSDRQIKKLSRTDRARYQEFLDQLATNTYIAAERMQQQQAALNKVRNEMQLPQDARLSDLTADQQIQAAQLLSHHRDQQPRPSELKKNSVSIQDEEPIYEVPRTPVVMEQAGQNSHVAQADVLHDEVMRGDDTISQGLRQQAAQHFEQLSPADVALAPDPSDAISADDQLDIDIHHEPSAAEQPVIYTLGQNRRNTQDNQGDQQPDGEPTVPADTNVDSPAMIAMGLVIDPLTAVGIDRSQAVEQQAYQDAAERMNQELQLAQNEMNAKGKARNPAIFIKHFVNNMWKGGLARGYYERKYLREAREKYQGIDSLSLTDQDGNLLTQDQMLRLAENDARYALILRMGQDSERFVATQAGETRTELSHDDESYQAMSQAIRQFATKDGSGNWLMDQDAFDEELNRVRAVMNDIDPDDRHRDQKLAKLTSLDNYQAVALYVRGQVEHGESLDDVMQGFRMYQAESREGARTEAFYTTTEQVIEKLSHSKLGQFIPAEWIATGVGIASWATGAATRNKVVQVASLGGSAVLSGIVAAAKESGSVKSDWSVMNRQLAVGGVNEANRDLKYQDQLEATVNDMVLADDLIQNIDQVRQSGDLEQMKAAIDEVILRQSISDMNGVDLIRYSSIDVVESQRVALLTHELQLEADYIALKRQQDPNFDFDQYRDELLANVDVMRELNYDYSSMASDREATLADMPEAARQIYDDMMGKEKALDKLRHRRMASTAVKTAAGSLAFSAGFQELVSLVNDDMQGLYEGITGQNSDAGTRTALEGLRQHIVDYFYPDEPAKALGNQLMGTTRHILAKDVSEEQLQQWRQQGYNIQENTGMVANSQSQTVSAQEAVQNNARIHRAGWFDNGTRFSDAGELSGYNAGSHYVYNLVDNYSSSTGLSVSGQQMLQSAQNGNLKLMVSPTAGTQMNPFEVTGHVDGSRIIFDVAPDSPVADMLANGSFHTAEVFDASTNIVLATEAGSGTASQLTTNVLTTTQAVVSYDVTAPAGAVLSSDFLAAGIPDVGVPMPVPSLVATHDGIQNLTISAATQTAEMRQAPSRLQRFANLAKNVAQNVAEDAVEETTGQIASRVNRNLSNRNYQQERLEQNVALVNLGLHRAHVVYGDAFVERLGSQLGDIIDYDNSGDPVLNDRGQELVADHMDDLAQDLERTTQELVDQYRERYNGNNNHDDNALRQTAQAQAWVMVLRGYDQDGGDNGNVDVPTGLRNILQQQLATDDRYSVDSLGEQANLFTFDSDGHMSLTPYGQQEFDKFVDDDINQAGRTEVDVDDDVLGRFVTWERDVGSGRNG